MKRDITYINGLTPLFDKYEFFIFDIWGVLHNGVELYPAVKATLLELKKREKDFCFLSNAPRPSLTVCKKLAELGLDFINPKQIITSGEFYRHEVQCKNSKLLKGIGNNIYALDEQNNRDILQGLDVNLVQNLEDTDCIMIMSYSEIEKVDENLYQQFFTKALALNLPAICPNPDVIVNSGDKIIYVNGYFAKMYKDMGGRVIYFGKPHQEIYEHLFQKLSPLKSSTLMIGDSLETDIKGANSFGINSLLLTGGIYKRENNIEKLFDLYAATPDYILNELCL